MADQTATVLPNIANKASRAFLRPEVRLGTSGARQLLRRIDAESEKTEKNSFRTRASLTEDFDQSSWLAARCFEKRPDDRPRFAHTAPFHFQIAGKPLKPRREEIEYLIKRVADEIERHQGTLSPEAIDEFKEALQVYQRLAE